MQTICPTCNTQALSDTTLDVEFGDDPTTIITVDISECPDCGYTMSPEQELSNDLKLTTIFGEN